MTDNLRDRIAAVIENSHPGKYGNSQSLLTADAVIDLLIDMAGHGELLKAIDRMHRE